MSKKKKSKTSKSPIVAHTRNSESPINELVEDAASCTIHHQSFLELRVLKSSPKSNGRGQPRLTLSEGDASALGVRPDDHLFIFFQNEASPSLAVCTVRIASRTAPSTPTPRNQSAAVSTTNEIRIPRGSCQIEPFPFLNPQSDESVSNVQSPPPSTNGVDQLDSNTLISPAGASATTPSKGFSFSSILPPSPKHSSPLKTPSRSSPVHVIRVIPFQSELGQELLKLAVQEASHMSIAPTTLANNKNVAQSGEIISRLFLAYSNGRFVKHNEIISISFRGQPLSVTVIAVKGSNEEMANKLGDHFAQLALDDDNLQTDAGPANINSLLYQVRQALKDVDAAKLIQLYRISFASKVAFVQARDDVEPEVDQASTISTAPVQLVAGLSSIVDQVRSLLLTPLLHPELYVQRRLPPPRGVLLHGSSGVGKSLLARQIGLELSSKHVPVQHVNCSSLQSQTSVVGEAEHQLIRLFRSCERLAIERKQSTSALLILDDIHLICPKRSGRHLGVDRLASTLLALMDGMESNANNGRRATNHVVILAVTSNPSLLDPAIRRPGRLDAEVEVPIPDEAARAEILRFQLDNLGPSFELPALLSDAELMTLSRLAKGFNGADCMLALKEAQRAALLRDTTKTIDARLSTIPLTLADLYTSIRAAKPSTLNSITVEIPQVPWSSIGGMDYVKEQLKEAIEFPTTHAHLFRELRIPPPRGVLLYGPPGCSKTLMARALATEGHMNFLAVKGPELLSKWLGESERALASLFRRARMASPCIIFFDEIDAIASKRGYGNGSSASDRLLSQLLTELDGIGSSNGMSTSHDGKEHRVVVVGATNRPDLLDNALTRPGRIDKMIYVGVPDEKSRASIFEIGLKGRALDDDIDIQMLASEDISGGISGAEAIAVCRDAALLALEEEDTTMASSTPVVKIAMRHLVQALNSLERQITPEMIQFYRSFQSSSFDFSWKSEQSS